MTLNTGLLLIILGIFIANRKIIKSHLNILREAHNKGVEKLLILEDDVDFVKDIKHVLSEVLDELDVLDWDICYFGHHLSLEQSGDNLFHKYEQGIQTTHFYAVKGEVIPRLISFLELVLSRPPGHPEGGAMHVDGAISTFRGQNADVKTVVLCNPIGYQRPSRTDIHELSLYDRIPLVKNIVSVIRSVIRRVEHGCR